MLKFFVLITALLHVVGLCNAQVDVGWASISTDKNTFSLSVPQGYLVDIDGDSKTIYAFVDSALLKIETKSVKKAKSLVKDSFYPKDGRISFEKFEIGDFLIWKMEFFDERVLSDVFDKKIYSTVIHAGSSTEYFDITVAAESKDNQTVARFLNSIKIDGKSLSNTTSPSIPADNQSKTFSSLTVSSEVASAITQDSSSITGRYSTIKEKNISDFVGYSRRLIILRKPPPSYTLDARMNSKQGTIKAKVQFLKSGKIGEIVVDSTLDRGLAASVGRAVMGIKFVPAEIAGKPVDVTRVLEYRFVLY